MDVSFPNKRLLDHSGVEAVCSTKRHRHQHHHTTLPSSPQSNINNPFRAAFKLSPGETLFRILCPASKTGGLIGKGGAIIRQFREETGAKIRIDESIAGSEERVIVIVADSNPNPNPNPKPMSVINKSDECNNSEELEESAAQKALVRVFERILNVDADESSEDNSGPVVCRLLAASNQIGSVLGRGGKIIEKIRHDTGAQVRVLPKDQIPDCAFPGDELIQMAGKFLAVKKALLSVTSCLQEAGNSKPMGMMSHGYGDRMGMEEEVVFRLLCHSDKVGCLIGKGGAIRRALQTETGASIKIADPSPDSDERVVVISARENLEQRHSPAQDAVMRVHSRIVEAGFESGAAIVARVLVHSRQIGCLWGKGGIIIAELRRLTGASIHIFPREQVVKYGMPSDEVVQVIGSLQCVQDVLFQITGRLRETFFPVKPYYSNGYMGPYPDMPPPSFRPRHDPAYSSVGPFEPPPFLHGEHFHPNFSHPYGNERPGYGPPFNRQSEPGSNRYVGEVGEFEGNAAKVNEPAARNESISVEMVIPQSLLGCIYGENNSNFGHIKEISGAKVALAEGKSGVVLSGTFDETQTAQCLIHAFILCEQHLNPSAL
ncbi:hypothetical protein QVD17_26086 [Tagetes erecta]|uniref:K Homology domain-containing protein n=1 Tax=Tagetes erecta TaxID=13708 RepID=A0AAD8K9H7_TARER|nr:hypothetical protein QVD17_26086 [Tagetes erecta]